MTEVVQAYEKAINKLNSKKAEIKELKKELKEKDKEIKALKDENKHLKENQDMQSNAAQSSDVNLVALVSDSGLE